MKCIEIAAKLDFQEKITPHHHVLLWFEGVVVKDPDIIDNLVRARLPRVTTKRERELFELLKKFNIH